MSVSEAGQPYFAWVRWMSDRYAAPIRLVFAFIATHNRFTIDRGGYAFNRSAPIITPKHGANEEQLLGILGLLNSSTACFWMKQVFMPKGGHGIGRGIQDEAWEGRLEFDGTKLKQFPLPDERPLSLTKLLDNLGQKLKQMIPANLLNADVPSRLTLANVRVRSNECAGTDGCRSRGTRLGLLQVLRTNRRESLASRSSSDWVGATLLRDRAGPKVGRGRIADCVV